MFLLGVLALLTVVLVGVFVGLTLALLFFVGLVLLFPTVVLVGVEVLLLVVVEAGCLLRWGVAFARALVLLLSVETDPRFDCGAALTGVALRPV